MKKTHSMENLPINLNRPKGKGAKMVPADLVSIPYGQKTETAEKAAK